ncbi:hypothetical protein [uncultured Oscillibacter sp.]|uniref:hypothetical protein n=1 Tax=uncultured Oscillibacter sp. TaxID=876091 RepID=UPI00258A440C|nr:hypothetical protein [uncultured Oscillibacter sp.]
MDFVWEKEAANQEPMPDGLPLAEQRAFQVVATLYARFYEKAISKEQAAQDKQKAKAELKQEIDIDNFRDNTAYEREKILRLSEQARIKARKEPTQENCLVLVDTVDGILKNELQQNVILSEHGANCPCCGKFFNQEHADRKPRFCEDCGAMLVW